MKNISAQIIFYDQSLFINQCLKQVCKVADEVILFKAKEKGYPISNFCNLNEKILENEKIKYYEGEEVGNERQHRLNALEKANPACDVIWIVDTDEYYDDENINKIADYNNRFDLLFCKGINYFRDTKRIMVSRDDKLYPARGRLSFIKRGALNDIRKKNTLVESIDMSKIEEKIYCDDIFMHHLSLCEPEQIHFNKTRKTLYRYSPNLFDFFQKNEGLYRHWAKRCPFYWTGIDFRYDIVDNFNKVPEEIEVAYNPIVIEDITPENIGVIIPYQSTFVGKSGKSLDKGKYRINVDFTTYTEKEIIEIVFINQSGRQSQTKSIKENSPIELENNGNSCWIGLNFQYPEGYTILKKVEIEKI